MALDRLLADPAWSVQGLLTTLDRDSDRVAMHDVDASAVRAQAAALALPLIEMSMDWPGPNERYESALACALEEARLRSPPLMHIAFGDMFLADLRAWREASLDRLGWRAVFPLWKKPGSELAREFHARGHRAVVTTVDLEQLDAAFCGREFDESLLEELPQSTDPCGENGEFHTLCHASPLFGTPLYLERGPTSTRDGRFRRMDCRLG
jgi:diphthamide synthase (EF-2-diphthine--ammonia ligase)